MIAQSQKSQRLFLLSKRVPRFVSVSGKTPRPHEILLPRIASRKTTVRPHAHSRLTPTFRPVHYCHFGNSPFGLGKRRKQTSPYFPRVGGRSRTAPQPRKGLARVGTLLKNLPMLDPRHLSRKSVVPALASGAPASEPLPALPVHCPRCHRGYVTVSWMSCKCAVCGAETTRAQLVLLIMSDPRALERLARRGRS